MFKQQKKYCTPTLENPVFKSHVNYAYPKVNSPFSYVRPAGTKSSFDATPKIVFLYVPKLHLDWVGFFLSLLDHYSSLFFVDSKSNRSIVFETSNEHERQQNQQWC